MFRITLYLAIFKVSTFHLHHVLMLQFLGVLIKLYIIVIYEDNIKYRPYNNGAMWDNRYLRICYPELENIVVFDENMS